MSILIDSSGWIEFFFDGPKSSKFVKHILSNSTILVPSLVIFEVYRKIKKEVSEAKAIFTVTQMQRGDVIALDDSLSLYAADLALLHGLAMADAIIYATARLHEAKLITADNDFRGLSDTLIL